MPKGKIKLAAILAALMLAGVLLPGAVRVATSSSPHQEGEYSALSTPEQVQHNGSESQSESEPPGRQFGSPSGREFFYKMLLSVSLVVVLGVSVVYLSKKLLPRFTNLPGKKIRVLETAYIAPRKGIHLIQAGTRRLLIASTNETITMLADVTDSATDFAAELEARS
jgi:flagellar biogenesis protein FliO